MRCFTHADSVIRPATSRKFLSIPRELRLTDKIKPLPSDEGEYLVHQTAVLPSAGHASYLYAFLQTQDNKVVLLKARLGKNVEYACSYVFDIYAKGDSQFFWDHLGELVHLFGKDDSPELFIARNRLIDYMEKVAQPLQESLILVDLEEHLRKRNRAYGELRLAFDGKNRLKLTIGESKAVTIGFYPSKWEPRRNSARVERQIDDDMEGIIVVTEYYEQGAKPFYTFLYGDLKSTEQITVPLEKKPTGELALRKLQPQEKPLPDHPLIKKRESHNTRTYLRLQDVDFGALGWLK